MDAAVKLETKRLADSLASINQLQRSLEEKDRQIESQNHQIHFPEGNINHLLHHRFGSKSERFDDLQKCLFVDENASCEIETVTEIAVPAHTRRNGGRRNPPANLPRVRVEHDLAEEEKECTCGHCLTRIGEETSFQYDVIPAKFLVIENVKLKYGCFNPACDQPPKTAQQIHHPLCHAPKLQRAFWLGSVRANLSMDSR